MSVVKMVWAIVTGWLTPGTTAFEKVTDIALDAINTAIATDRYWARFASIRSTVESAIEMLETFQRFCPEAWASQYSATLVAIKTMHGVLADNEIETDEVRAAIESVQIAYAKWMAED